MPCKSAGSWVGGLNCSCSCLCYVLLRILCYQLPSGGWQPVTAPVHGAGPSHTACRSMWQHTLLPLLCIAAIPGLNWNLTVPGCQDYHLSHRQGHPVQQSSWQSGRAAMTEAQHRALSEFFASHQMQALASLLRPQMAWGPTLSVQVN